MTRVHRTTARPPHSYAYRVCIVCNNFHCLLQFLFVANIMHVAVKVLIPRALDLVPRTLYGIFHKKSLLENEMLIAGAQKTSQQRHKNDHGGAVPF
jgi:hypothetical protein